MKALQFWKPTADKIYSHRPNKRALRLRTGKRGGATTKGAKK